MDDNNPELVFEKREVSEGQLQKAEMWEEMMNGVPEFAENNFGIAEPGNDYYGEASEVQDEIAEEDGAGEYDQGVKDAMALMNYALNAAARELGVETVVQGVKSFAFSGEGDPIAALYKHLGVNTPEEREDIREEQAVVAPGEAELREVAEVPSQNKSKEGAIKAIEDMKELIAEVEGADPKYNQLRQEAEAAGKGYFEYAVSKFGTQGLTELFQVLGTQKVEKDETGEVEEKEEKDAVRDEVERRDDDRIGTGGEEEKEEQEDDRDGELAKRETLNPEILRK